MLFFDNPLLALGQFDFGGNFGPDAHFRSRRQRFRRIRATSGPCGAAAGKSALPRGAASGPCGAAPGRPSQCPGDAGQTLAAAIGRGLPSRAPHSAPCGRFSALRRPPTVRFGPGKPLLAPFGRPAGVLTSAPGANFGAEGAFCHLPFSRSSGCPRGRRGLSPPG